MSSHRRRQSFGRGVDATGRTIKRDRFLQLPHFLLTSEAWKSLNPIERTLFIEVAQRYNGHNNGEIGLGVACSCFFGMSGLQEMSREIPQTLTWLCWVAESNSMISL